MATFKFWEHLPVSAYRSWKANKFTERARALIDRLEDVPSPVPVTLPGAVLDEPALADRAGDVLGAGFRTFKAGLDWHNENVVDPVAGHVQAVRELYGARPDTWNLAAGGPRPVEHPEVFTEGWRGHGEMYRQADLTGAERLALDVAADPLTYWGVGGKLAASVPGLRRVAPAIAAVEALPGRVERAIAGELGRGVKAVLPDVLTRPSVRSVAGAEADRVFDLARRAATAGLGPDEAAELEGYRHLYPGLDAILGEAISGPLPSPGRGPYRSPAPGPLHFEPRTRWSFKPDDWPPRTPADLRPRPPWSGGVEPSEPARTYLRPDPGLDAAQAAADDVFARKVAETRQLIREKREAEKAAGGVAGVKARGQDMLDRIFLEPYQQGFSVGGVRVVPAEVNRSMATATLNTPAYVAGNAMEDPIRSALGGVEPHWIGTREFAERTAAMPGMPRELYFEAGSTARGLGTSQTTGNPVTDALTGRSIVNLADRTTAGFRRNFLAEQTEAGLRAGLPVEEASARALAAFQREFPNYADESNLDAFMKAIFPFWTYEKQRPGYLARKAAEYPGLAGAVADYYGATDEGNIPIGGDFEVNPFRGTVLNQVATIGRPDYPSYAQGTAGTIEQAQEQLGRAGFYPGTVAQAVLAAQRALEGEPIEAGRLIPTPALAPLLAAEGLGAVPVVGELPVVAQVSAGARRLHELVGDRFHDFAVARELAAMGVEPERATPAERAEAAERAAARLLGLTEAGFVRWRPEGPMRRERLEAAIAAGVPEDVARTAAKRGNPLSAVDAEGRPYLNAAEKRALYDANQEWERWQQVTERLRRPAEQRAAAETRAYFDATEAIDAATRDALRTLYLRFNEGAISGRELRAQRRQIMAEARARREQAEATARQRGALVDREARAEFAARTGRELGPEAPEDQVARAYYAIEPAEDPVTGRVDWDGFFAEREAFLARLDPETRRYVTEVYPARRYADDPIVAAGEQWYRQAMEGVREYMSIPKYLGIAKADEEEVDAAAELLAYLRQMYPEATTDMLRAIVAQQYPRGAWLGPLANRLRNPERRQFLVQNPSVRLLLGDVTGEELAGLGLY